MKMRLGRVGYLAIFGTLAVNAMTAFKPTLAQDKTAASAAPQRPAKEALTTIVNLNLGITTLSTATNALTKQTGVTIQPAEYLRDRIIVVRMNGVTAAQALADLCELEDWTWTVLPPDKVLIVRRRLRMDASPESIPRLMQAAVPRDIRTYASIPTPEERAGISLEVFATSLGATMHSVGDRLSRVVAVDQSDLLRSLSPGITTMTPVPYANLSAKQRQELVTSLVFPLLRRTDYQLLHADLLPHVANVDSAVLKISGASTLLIGSRISDGRINTEIGFGAPLQ